MGEQLYARLSTRGVIDRILKSGKKGKPKWVRGYRAPRPEDDNGTEIQSTACSRRRCRSGMRLDIVPSETVSQK